MTLWIVGAGGVGREALDACLASGIPCGGFLDEGKAGSQVRDLHVFALYEPVKPGEYVVAVADPLVRHRLAKHLDERGWTPTSIAHVRSATAPETRVELGALLLANAYLSSSVSVGRHCQVHYNATVGHDAVLQDFVTIYPGANVSGSAYLAEGATIGSNAVVLQGRSIGKGAFVGAGAVVTRDVEPGAVVVGSPARRIARGRHQA